MISQNREFSEKKGVALLMEKRNLSIQTVEMNWKVLCHAFTGSLSL